MTDFPRIVETDHSLTAEFAPNPKPASYQPLEMVLDFGESGALSGVEIINLICEVGKNCLGLVSTVVPTEGDALKYSYDDDCDAFYLHLRVGRSLHQKVIQGAAGLDADGRIASLNAQW